MTGFTLKKHVHTLSEQDGVDFEASTMPQSLGQLLEVKRLQEKADLQSLSCALHLVRDGHVWKDRTKAISMTERE